MDNCKHAYEVRAKAAYCPKCDEWASLPAALRYTNKRLASTEAENVTLQAENEKYNSALWKLAGKAARLEFGDDHEHIDRLQTAAYSEALLG